MAEIQKPADQAEQKPDASVKKPDNLAKDRTVTGDQVTEADGLRTNKFKTFGQMRAFTDNMSPDEAVALQDNPLLIDRGDGTEITSDGARVVWDPFKVGKEKAQEVIKASEHAVFPYRGNEDSQLDYAACAAAYRAFPEFSRHPNIDRAVIPALIRNELHHYFSPKEKPAEDFLNATGNPGLEKTSLGPGQVQVRHIRRLMESFPQLRNSEQGAIMGDPFKAALDPAKAPWFVAAYLAEKIQQREAHGDIISHQSLIQDFNPGGSKHFENVHKQLLWIKTHHRGW